MPLMHIMYIMMFQALPSPHLMMSDTCAKSLFQRVCHDDEMDMRRDVVKHITNANGFYGTGVRRRWLRA